MSGLFDQLLTDLSPDYAAAVLVEAAAATWKMDRSLAPVGDHPDVSSVAVETVWRIATSDDGGRPTAETFKAFREQWLTLQAWSAWQTGLDATMKRAAQQKSEAAHTAAPLILKACADKMHELIDALGKPASKLSGITSASAAIAGGRTTLAAWTQLEGLLDPYRAIRDAQRKALMVSELDTATVHRAYLLVGQVADHLDREPHWTALRRQLRISLEKLPHWARLSATDYDRRLAYASAPTRPFAVSLATGPLPPSAGGDPAVTLLELSTARPWVPSHQTLIEVWQAARHATNPPDLSGNLSAEQIHRRAVEALDRHAALTELQG